MSGRIVATHRTTAQLLARAKADSDPVSVFVNGSSWADADCAIFVVKDGQRAFMLREWLARQGLVTDKPVVDPGSSGGGVADKVAP